MRVIEENEKAGLKLNIQKTKIMTYGSITSWQIEGDKVEAVTNFIFLGSKITADSDCSCDINRCLLLERKPKKKPKEQRHQFANKGASSQSYDFCSSYIQM